MKAEAQLILEKLKRAQFSDGEVQLGQKRMTEMQIDAGEVSLLRTTDNYSLTLRGFLGSRYASISLNQMDDQSVNNGIEQLKLACAASPEDDARQLAPDQGLLQFEHGPKDPEVEPMHKRLLTFGEQIRSDYPEVKLEQAIIEHTNQQVWTVNTLGLDAVERQGRYSFVSMFSAKKNEKTSSFNYSGAQLSNLNEPLLDWGLIKENIESSVRELDHKPLSGKFVGPIMMTPESFADMLGGWLAHLGNQHLIAGTSGLKDKMNQAVANPLLTLKVETRRPELANHDFVTGDGYKSEDSTIVDQGVLKSWLLSDYGARKTKLPRAKNSAANWIVTPGTQSRQSLLKGVRRGVWLGRFSGGRPADNGDFSGVAKNSFLIENGDITMPISEVMISGNLFQLMNQIVGISSERISNGTTLLPWVLAEGLTIAGS